MTGRKTRLSPFGKAVRKRLIDREMTQVELAVLLGCSKQYLWKILCGERSGRKYRKKILQILCMKDVA